MLDRMSKFDLRNAKCTLETDRRVIEEQAPGFGRSGMGKVGKVGKVCRRYIYSTWRL